MKKLGFLFIVLFGISTGFSQNYYMASPEGFGAETTGGGNTTPVTVTTYANLKARMTLAGPGVILVSGIITIPSGQPISAIITNKSIIGLPGAKLVNENQSNPGAGIIYLKPGSNNVIIRNLIFVGPAAYDIDGQDNLTADGCTNLWVDHCEFQDGQDGNFDNKGNTDDVTVSWCKFTYLKAPVSGGSGGTNDHRFTNLVGSNASDAPADGHYSITFQNCYWAAGCKERMPRARNAELHILNCYYNTGVTSSKAIGLGGGTNNSTCYVQNTNFANVTNVYTPYPADGGTASVSFSNCLNGVANVGTVNAPSYTTTAFPVANVATAIPDAGCGAGATLQVTSAGVISASPCASLGIEETISDLKIKFYPTLVEDTLTIEFPSNVSGKATITIVDINGKKVYNFTKNASSNEKFQVNLNTIVKGIYFCTIQIEDKSTKWKFVKK